MTNKQALVMVSARRTADGRIVDMVRLDGGQLLRAAMEARGVSIQELARRTAELDPDGRGVNWRSIGFLVSQGRSARETTTVRNADLIARALDVPIAMLFRTRIRPVSPQAETSTHRRYVVDVP